MINITTDEFPLVLSTGEEIHLTVIQLGLFGLPDHILDDCEQILSLCTQVTHSELEDAKAGYDVPFKKKMKSQPIGCLLRVDKYNCSELQSCSMAVRGKCDTKNIDKRYRPQFPSCWTYDSKFSESKELVDIIVHAWRQRQHVVLVTIL